MNIYILEDNLHFQEKIFGVINQLKHTFSFPIESVRITEHPNELLEHVKNATSNDLLLLDIEIGRQFHAGLELAAKIRATMPQVNLVFLTAHIDLISETFRYQTFALDFIGKSISTAELRARLAKAIRFSESKNNEKSESKYVCFEDRYTHFKILKKDILYFETSATKHKIILNAKYKAIEFTGTLVDIENKEMDFVRTHRAFVANFSNVIGVDKRTKTLLFSENVCCPISRYYYKSVLSKLAQVHE